MLLYFTFAHLPHHVLCEEKTNLCFVHLGFINLCMVDVYAPILFHALKGISKNIHIFGDFR